MSESLAYLAGVLHGDGWCTGLSIGLRCVDHDFASTFALALNTVAGTTLVPRFVDGNYWSVRAGNKSGRFDHLKGFEPRTVAEQAAWLRGLFDSEGNAQVTPAPRRGPRSIHRRIAMYSTEMSTLNRAAMFLSNLGIDSSLRSMKLTEGHLGTKPVFELRVNRRTGFKRFYALVNSSIERKRNAIAIIATSYLDPTMVARQNQLKGAKAKTAKLFAVTAPAVLTDIRNLLARGEKPTWARCQKSIPGYGSIAKYFRHATIIKAAVDRAQLMQGSPP